MRNSIQNSDGLALSHRFTDDHETLTVATTIAADDHGKTFDIATDAIVITLLAVGTEPANARAAKGFRVRFRNTGADGNNTITLAPNASDKFLGELSGVALTGTDDKDIVNTKATAKNGDYVELVSDGVTGWYVEHSTGIWSEEDQTASPEVAADNVTVKAGDSGKVFTQGTDAKVSGGRRGDGQGDRAQPGARPLPGVSRCLAGWR